MTEAQAVLEANIAVHTKSVDIYNNEPHFNPENVNIVENFLKSLIHDTNATRLLDMGCGTGFIINIAKKYLPTIHGVDITQAMLNMVDTSGPAEISLFQGDIAEHKVEENSFDLVTAYSFLHHLYDIKPSLEVAYRGLKHNGKFYADLEPNYYCWEAVNNLSDKNNYDHIVQRERDIISRI